MHFSKKTAINKAAALLKGPNEGVIPNPDPLLTIIPGAAGVIVYSQDSRGLVAPVTVAQQPLVEFSGRQPRQLGLEVDRARDLLARQRLAAEQDQFVGEIRTRQNSGHRLD